jgi:hypothetical protein
MEQLKYYINPGCPPIRTPADGNEPFMRPEAGFNPSWFHRYCGIDFGERWHTDVPYRLEAYTKMQKEIKKRFPGYNIGHVLDSRPPDLLTGIFGIGIMDLLFGRPLQFFSDKWPVPVGEKLTDQDIPAMERPEVQSHPFMDEIFRQIGEIHRLTGSAFGYLNWQGMLNTAFRFRGELIFTDLLADPELTDRLLGLISETYIEGVKAVYAVQREYGTDNTFATVANCTVNMVGPKIYGEVLLPYDVRISEQFTSLGIHNCAWTVTPYIDHYARVPRVSYIDMGIESDLARVRQVFPGARRNCLYKSIDLKNKSREEIRRDFEFIAENLAPCDVGMPDIEHDVPDEKIMFAVDLCTELSERSGT